MYLLQFINHLNFYKFPPLTGKHWPVMKLDQSESKKMTQSAMSEGKAILPFGIESTPLIVGLPLEAPFIDA